MNLSNKLATLRGGFLLGLYFLYIFLISIYLIFFTPFIIKKYKE